MKNLFDRNGYCKGLSFFLLALFVCLSIHFHEHDFLSHFHFHNLNLSVINCASSNLLTDGHICPCFVAMLDMPTINAIFWTTLNETNLFGSRSSDIPLSLTLEIFHPPQAI